MNYSSASFSNLAASNMAQINLFDVNAGSDTSNFAFFNSLFINAVPEPSVTSLLAVATILGGWLFIRRRRA